MGRDPSMWLAATVRTLLKRVEILEVELEKSKGMQKRQVHFNSEEEHFTFDPNATEFFPGVQVGVQDVGDYHGELPRGGDALPRADGEFPRADGDALRVADGELSRADGDILRADDVLPCGDDALPCADDELPRADGRLPRADGVLPRADGELPRGDDALLHADGELPRADGREHDPPSDGCARWERIVRKVSMCKFQQTKHLFSMFCFKYWQLYVGNDEITDKSDPVEGWDRCLVCDEIIDNNQWSFAKDFEAQDLCSTFGMDFAFSKIRTGWLCECCSNVIDVIDEPPSDYDFLDGEGYEEEHVGHSAPSSPFICHRCGCDTCKGGLWCRGASSM